MASPPCVFAEVESHPPNVSSQLIGSHARGKLSDCIPIDIQSHRRGRSDRQSAMGIDRFRPDCRAFAVEHAACPCQHLGLFELVRSSDHRLYGQGQWKPEEEGQPAMH